VRDLTAVFAAFPILETERCILRASTPEDAPDLFRIMSDVRVTRYIGQQPMDLLDKAVARVQMFHNIFAEQTALPWVVASRTNEQMIGTCAIWNIDRPNHRAEIGYVLAPEWWGKGLTTEAVAAAVTFGFTNMGLHRIEAETDPENAASRRVLEKLGFVQEGHFREYYYNPVGERFTDKAVFSLLQSAWMDRLDKDTR
jgi:ribosomal-protein-alanine N-acetyltransferase